VQLSLIALFKNLNLDMLITCRAAPGHSWRNPVECRPPIYWSNEKKRQ